MTLTQKSKKQDIKKTNLKPIKYLTNIPPYIREFHLKQNEKKTYNNETKSDRRALKIHNKVLVHSFFLLFKDTDTFTGELYK